MGKDARTFGQDIMRGEHKVGGGMSKQRLAPGGGCAWLGGPKTASSGKYRGANDMSATIRRDKSSACVDEAQTGTSIFDPVLCELAYRWFSAPGHLVLDPFAGGSVRGVVASCLGRRYWGGELRAEQVAANKAQLHLCKDPLPHWHCGDSAHIGAAFGGEADFVFSCPPYADLEVYSDDPADISNMSYDAFLDVYRGIIRQCVGCLKPDSFACFVVGEVRDKRGNYLNFVGDTVEAFRAAGAHYYNEAILLTAVGSLPVRVGRQFKAGRKLGKTHQNVLVFVKGDGKRAAQRCSSGGAG